MLGKYRLRATSALAALLFLVSCDGLEFPSSGRTATAELEPFVIDEDTCNGIDCIGWNYDALLIEFERKLLGGQSYDETILEIWEDSLSLFPDDPQIQSDYFNCRACVAWLVWQLDAKAD